jgi:hypothetical protein
LQFAFALGFCGRPSKQNFIGISFASKWDEMTNIFQEQWEQFMSRQANRQDREESKRLKDHKFQVEDECGWAGQHGQFPANEEERSYRPHGREDSEAVKKKD